MPEIEVRKYVVRLSAEERQTLEAIIHKGTHPSAQVLKAQILLKADVSEAGEGWNDKRIVAAFDTSLTTVHRTRQQLVGQGFDAGTPAQTARAAINRANLRWRERSQANHARLLRTATRTREMVASSAGGEGRGAGNCCTRQRQYDRPDAKKNILKPHLREQWVIPPAANAAFVAAMEDILAVYTRPRDPDRPLVCLDETSKQLIRETRTPVPMKRGQPARVDYEYERNGTANIFMLFAPLEGWRHVEVTDRRAATDYAAILKDLSDRHFPDASQIVLVQDNLSTHTVASMPGSNSSTFTRHFR